PLASPLFPYTTLFRSSRNGIAEHTMNIDFHSHVIPQSFVDAIEKKTLALMARVEGSGAERKVVHEQGYVYPLFSEFTDVSAKLRSEEHTSELQSRETL